MTPPHSRPPLPAETSILNARPSHPASLLLDPPPPRYSLTLCTSRPQAAQHTRLAKLAAHRPKPLGNGTGKHANCLRDFGPARPFFEGIWQSRRHTHLPMPGTGTCRSACARLEWSRADHYNSIARRQKQKHPQQNTPMAGIPPQGTLFSGKAPTPGGNGLDTARRAENTYGRRERGSRAESSYPHPHPHTSKFKFTRNIT